MRGVSCPVIYSVPGCKAIRCVLVLCDTHDTSILIVDTYVTIPEMLSRPGSPRPRPDQDQTGRDRDRDQDQGGRDQDQVQDQQGRDQDQDQDLKKVVLIGLETKTRSRDPHPWYHYLLIVHDLLRYKRPLGFNKCSINVHALFLFFLSHGVL